MSYIHPALAEHLRRRWERADAYRFAAPGTPEAKMPGTLHPWAAVARAEEAKAADDAKAHAEFVAEVEALRAANERVRIMLADVKFELALRALGRKYSPDQPRVPGGHGRESGRWTDGQSTSDGGEGAGHDLGFGPDLGGWHDFTVGPTLACAAELRCSPEEMADQLARFSVPGRDPSNPVWDGVTSIVYGPNSGLPAGWVWTTVSDDGLTTVNRTTPAHLFYDGVVVRTAEQRDGAWYVTTHGFGNNVVPGMDFINQVEGPAVFRILDQRLRENIERHHAKGIAHLAMRRLDGGGRDGRCALLAGPHHVR